MRDADIWTHEANNTANRVSALEKQGVCTHGYVKGLNPQNSGAIDCIDCGTHFDTHEDWQEDRQQWF